MAAYPPGSIFKTVVSLIALEEEQTTIKRTIPCFGGYYYGGRIRPACHAHPTCHTIDQAIQHSCNAYFAQVFRDIIDMEGYTKPQKGLSEFNHHLNKFNLGRTLDIDFPQESRGDYYDDAAYKELYKDNNNGAWFSPYIMSVGIGQGEVTLTTAQMANLAVIIANKGTYRIPHLAKAFVEDGQVVDIPEKYLEDIAVDIKEEHFLPIIEGMEKVVTSGTARSALTPGIAICGKTGTAENPHGEDHSIFFAFAPKDDPQIAIAVYVEHGRFGGTIAAPIASLLIEKYINDSIAPARKYREDYVLNYKSLNTTP
jgi:penicillin-binding protein 2